MINEAISILSEGKISAEDIDIATRMGVNHPMGPLHSADFIGLDVYLTIFEYLYKQNRNIKYKPHNILVRKVRNGNLGKKREKAF
jgi:3-hydroxybutyryl-CoA dehydrogenase